jgi:two-component system, NtrC family, sensor kinase
MASRNRILIIDDDDTITLLMHRILQKEHDVFVERSPRAALGALLAGAGFDLILCDVRMSEMSGLELCTALRDKRPDMFCNVVLMTGGGLDPGEEQVLSRFGAPTLTKPISPKGLRDFVRDFVGGRAHTNAAVTG